MTKYTGPIKEVEVVEKVKVKQEIATAIESVKSDTHWSLDSFLDSHARNENSGGGELWTDEFHPLNKLSVSELAKVIYIGYEIEPEQPKFQPGDSIIRIDDERFKSQILVDSVKYFDEITDYLILSSGWQVPVSEVRHATPEEIYWLETLGREKVGEFHLGDIFIRENGEGFAVDTNGLLDYASKSYKEGNFQGLHPADSFRPFKKEPE